MINLKKQKIIGWAVIAVIALLGIASIVGNIVNYGFGFASISTIFFVFMICGILCFIAYISIVKNTFSAAAKAQNEQEFHFDKKGFLIGLLIFIVCAGASSPLFIFASKELSKTSSPNYVKTEAIVTYIDYGDSQGLKYLYFDEEGNEVISNNGASFGGINFKAGKIVTVYYNKKNPQMLVNLGTPILELCGALFFVLGGLIAFLANMGLNKFIPIIFCLTFMLFAAGLIAGTMLSSGLNLWEVFSGGALGFGCSLFFLIGLALLIPSVFDLIKAIKSSIKNMRENKERREQYKALGLEEIKNKYFGEDEAAYNEKPKDKVKKQRKPRVRYKHKFVGSVLIFVFVGLVFGGAGCFMFAMSVKDLIVASHYEKCEATVTDIRLFEKKGDLLGAAIYTYVVDGVEYTQEATYSQSAELLPEIGKVVTIHYNKDNPLDIKDGDWISLVELFVSLIPISVGVGMFVYSFILTRTEKIEPKKKLEIEDKKASNLR